MKSAVSKIISEFDTLFCIRDWRYGLVSSYPLRILLACSYVFIFIEFFSILSEEVYFISIECRVVSFLVV